MKKWKIDDQNRKNARHHDKLLSSTGWTHRPLDYANLSIE